ncbi:ABC transporter permease subunit [Bacillus sp. FJAT-47783]|uniref:ABC transporter permease subunit n=1 Tax=Bacillus sp. FJAT-47783 TaxID=2922712 RepID=UPI001FAD5EFB|nr:ABC transporter permease subunit [Bacillus sp. FJAT-47783]
MNRAIIVSEMKKIVRSRSLLIFGLLLMVLLLSITSVQIFALPATSSFTRYSASFLNVLLFLFPLFTLGMGAMSVASDIESRWFTLLRTYPIKIASYTWGKFVALICCFWLIVGMVYGLVLILFSLKGLSHFDFLLFFLSLVIIVIFSSVSILIGSVSQNRIHSLSLALGTWAFFLLIFDYLIMAVGTVVSGTMLKIFVMILTFTNPAEWIRIGYILYSGNATVLGPVYFDFANFFLAPVGICVYLFICVLWVAIPIFVSGKILEKKEGR